MTEHDSRLTLSDAASEESQSCDFRDTPTTATEETNLFDLLFIVIKHKRLIAATTGLCTIVAVIYALSLPNQYTAEAKLLAPQSRDSMASLMTGSLSNLSGLGAVKSLSASALGLSDPNAMYIGVLQSHTIADQLIERFDLKRVYHTKLLEDTRKALGRATNVASSKDGGITIQVTDLDRKRAADLANAYVEEFQRLTDQLALTEATQRRVYYERELSKVQEQLNSAEAALKGTQEKTGMLDPDSQAKSIVQIAVALKAQIAAKEVEINGMSTFATSKNPDLILAKDQLASLHALLAQLKYGSSSDGDILVPTGEIPEAGLEYLRHSRDVMYYAQIIKLLATQDEAAKADEGRNAVIVQVLDPALPPERKSKPHRALIVIFIAMLAASGSFVASFVIEGLENLRQDPLRSEQLDSLKTMLFGGPRRTKLVSP